MITFQIGVNIVGEPMFHTIIKEEEKQAKFKTIQNVVLKRRHKGYQGCKRQRTTDK